MNRKKVCVVTSSRADYGLLQPLLVRLKIDPRFNLQLVATGSHLSKLHGYTYRCIIQDGFRLHKKIDILAGRSDSVLGIIDAKAVALQKLARIFIQLKPELVVLLGDRYEIHAAAEAAFLLQIPIAHIAGGDVTEGAFDDALRHGITKMSQLHFATCEDSARRIAQLGEEKSNIYTVGHLGIDAIKQTKFLKRSQLEQILKFSFRKRNVLVTFHPETLNCNSAEAQTKELLTALSNLGGDVGIIITRPNADPEGMKILKLISDFSARNSNTKLFASLGQQCYLSVMNEVDAVVGNSSSGIYEAPSFKIPTVNIGDRQKGRLFASSVINCSANASDIFRSIQKAFHTNCSKIVNPYGGGRSAQKIVRVLSSKINSKPLIKKRFVDRGETFPASRSVYIIAEIGVNHNGSVALAKRLIDQAFLAGADAVKFQTFISEELVTRHAKKARYQMRTTKGTSQYDMLKKFELSPKAFYILKDYCKKRKIEFLSTAFDSKSLKLIVESLKVKKLKVSSGELTNAPFVLDMARTGLPMIVSTGMSDLKEIRKALQLIAFGYLSDKASLPSQPKLEAYAASAAGVQALKEKVILLQCTTEYPAPFEEVNLRAMDTLREEFGVRVGLSDHSAGWSASVAAAARGAAVIEKHLTLNRNLKGPDHKASLIPEEFRIMVKTVREIEKSLGSGDKTPARSEVRNRAIARKCIVARSDIAKGDVFTPFNLATKRIGRGVSPFRWWDFMGKRAKKSFKKDNPVSL